MNIKETGGYIFIHLEENDFKEYNWREFLNELKKIADEYKDEEEIWCIEDTPRNRNELSYLIEKYFKDKNQLNLFGG